MKALLPGLILCASMAVQGYSQTKISHSISLSTGLWSNFSEITHGSDEFRSRGPHIPGIAAAYELQYGRFSYGINAELFSMNFKLSHHQKAAVGQNVAMPEEMNLILAFGLSAKYNLLQHGCYRLNATLSPRIGYQLHDNGYPIDQGIIAREQGESFYYTNDVQHNNKYLPLLKAGLENEFRIAKRGALTVSVGYQQGFISALSYDYYYTQNGFTSAQSVRRVSVETKASNISYQLGYRLYL